MAKKRVTLPKDFDELITAGDANGSDEDAITERLCELSVLWVLLNQNPILLGKTNYNR
ncbi:MAG: hypothetical protein ACTTKP_01405 [Catonella sp.]|uniref:hypothetical protein n=1 Tax=Catonella sp. TaxID=2382125 RepID=UPI003F9FEC21